ncbi:hypothetical protein MAR_037634 [Mya arenaria]|uniref:Myb-like domain-containing protein n=2 Tax=Mya arenaria TaxID=6604 RepID=A0ABY7FBZ6_MYAAR|nr:hypothetical protein MAR_001510 [Mya arenaria]WAR23965.1 hypothetical protein MAR_037634 [Mya arenaria]
MSLSGKEKKRGPNWTIEERNTLIELCRASTNTLKMNWGEVADRVNSIGGNSRVAPEVKKKWTDMKRLQTHATPLTLFASICRAGRLPLIRNFL